MNIIDEFKKLITKAELDTNDSKTVEVTTPKSEKIIPTTPGPKIDTPEITEVKSNPSIENKYKGVSIELDERLKSLDDKIKEQKELIAAIETHKKTFSTKKEEDLKMKQNENKIIQATADKILGEMKCYPADKDFINNLIEHTSYVETDDVKKENLLK